MLGPVLGEPLLSEFASINGRDDAPSSTGSSYDNGWYGYVYKDLRSELGLTVTDPYSRQYCGGRQPRSVPDVAVGGDPGRG